MLIGFLEARWILWLSELKSTPSKSSYSGRDSSSNCALDFRSTKPRTSALVWNASQRLSGEMSKGQPYSVNIDVFHSPAILQVRVSKSVIFPDPSMASQRLSRIGIGFAK